MARRNLTGRDAERSVRQRDVTGTVSQQRGGSSMSIGSIQSVACMGLGALLGFVVATNDMAPASRVDGVRHPVRPVAAETGVSDPDVSRPSCCPDRPASSVLLAQADAKTTAAQADPTASGKKPNIVVIMADDVGTWNISAYHRGMMGGRTPNIDRIAREGALFTDYYAQQSCTAGRAAFILGQNPFRTGLLKVGMPAAKKGLQDKDPTIAELLKPYGYATAQTGKNHLGDRNEFLPTVHGFDEFYGVLYHLNAMEEPYQADYPKAREFRARFGPRNIVDSKATGIDDPTTDPRWGKVGKQKIVDAGPLPPHPNMDPQAKVSMEDVEEELVRRSLDFIDRCVNAQKPFFLWHNATRCHVWTHLSSKWKDKSGYGLYADAMMELDWEVGELLKKLDELGIADNTIVLFTSDNGAEISSWPDGGNSPFRGEKGTTFEGGFRVPACLEVAGRDQARHHHQRHHRQRGLASDVPGRRRKSERERRALEGNEGRRQDVQEPPRRLQFLAIFSGQSRQRPASRGLLLYRQR